MPVIVGDCRDVMRTMADASVDAIVTDPPYELGFMGKRWDASGIAYNVDVWRECLRVLKPGGHLLAFGGTRTYHRMACAIEDAGFEVRDSIHWIYGSGFPKSLDVSKAFDKAAGAKREVVGISVYGDGHIQRSAESIGYGGCDPSADMRIATAPATDAAKQWQGWGTALKPAHEPIVVARKPLEGTVAANVQKWGVGALNIDGCRIETDWSTDPTKRGWQGRKQPNEGMFVRGVSADVSQPHSGGRWPANIVLDEDAGRELDEQSGTLKSGKMLPTHTNASRNIYGQNAAEGFTTMETYGDSGGASRFFYCAKASKSERGDGNIHPTVKPTSLMRWLVRLVTPPGGFVLDPFTGSGSTGVACALEGFRFVGSELSPEYAAIAEARIAHAAGTVAKRDDEAQAQLFG